MPQQNWQLVLHDWARTLNALAGIIFTVIWPTLLYVTRPIDWRWFLSHPIDASQTILFLALLLFFNAYWLVQAYYGHDSVPKALRPRIALLSLFLLCLTYFVFLPSRFPGSPEPDVTVLIGGSVTLGEDFALKYVEALAVRNRATRIRSNYEKADHVRLAIDAIFDGVRDADRPDPALRGISHVRFVVDARGRFAVLRTS